MKIQSRGSQFTVLILLLVGLAIAPPALAQRKSTAEEWKDIAPPSVEVFDLNYISRKTFEDLLETFGLDIKESTYHDNRLFARFKNPASGALARKVLEKVDMPPQKLELRFQFILASSGTQEGRPVENRQLLNQLKQVFRFTAYRLLADNYLVAVSGDDAEIANNVVFPGSEGKQMLRIEVEPVFIDEGNGIVKLNDMEVSRAIPPKGKMVRILETTLNVGNGDTVIVGSTNINGNDTALITIVTVKAK